MAVLDVDLDFFLDGRPDRSQSGRADSAQYKPWLPAAALEYLEAHCDVNRNEPKRGAVVVHHHEVFSFWRDLVRSGDLHAPFDLIHIDSHADLGMELMGPSTLSFVECEFLGRPISARSDPPTSGDGALNPGNYLLYALAAGWLSSLTYVHHPDLPIENCGLHYIADELFEGCNPKAGNLQLKFYGQHRRHAVERLKNLDPLTVEPPVPLKLVAGNTDWSASDISHIYIAQSPDYTPVEADEVFTALRQLVL